MDPAWQRSCPQVWLTNEDLAQRWRMPLDSVRYLRQTGKGPTGVKIGRRVLYRIADVEAFERDAAGGAA